jgi:hypothetical protein
MATRVTEDYDDEDSEIELTDKPSDYKPKPRTCPVCDVEYPSSIGHFGKHGTNANCKSCARIRSKVCKCCGGEYFGIIRNFKRGGKVTDTCNACYKAKIDFENSVWWAKRDKKGCFISVGEKGAA